MTQKANDRKIIYMDNAATSYPKPACVIEAVANFMKSIGASAGRSGHSMSIEAGRLVYESREALAELFNSNDPSRVIFTHNATAATNTALYGYLNHGDKVVVSSFEHNSVMRPLRNLEKIKNIKLFLAKTNGFGIDFDDLRTKSKGAKLIAVTHGNNVTGHVNDINTISKIAKENGCGFLVDAAQTAGLIDIDIQTSGIDFLCFSGHKSLYAPQGTGALVIGENIDHKKLSTIMQGGTGSSSEFETHPETLPDKFESGTLNCVGIAGLNASVNWLQKEGIKNIYSKEKHLRDVLYNGLQDIDKIKLYAAGCDEVSTGVISFIIKNQSVSDVCLKLDERYGIMARVGLHCAPAVHKSIGTFPEGTVRLSLGAFSNIEDVKLVIKATKEIAK